MSQIEKEKNNNNIYLKIIDGSLKQAVKPGTMGAEERTWQAGGKSGVAHEISSPAAFGKITNIAFYDGEYEGKKFKTLNITLDENEDGKTPVISASVGTKYAQDIMKKLPGINFDEEVRIRPYSYIPDGEEKNVVGVEITQRDRDGKFTEKVDNHFIKKTVVDGIERWIPTNGFPERTAPWSEQNDEEREIYKIQVRSFLIKSTEKIAQNFAEKPKSDAFDEAFKEKPAYPTDEINPDDIPFN